MRKSDESPIFTSYLKKFEDFLHSLKESQPSLQILPCHDIPIMDPLKDVYGTKNPYCITRDVVEIPDFFEPVVRKTFPLQMIRQCKSADSVIPVAAQELMKEIQSLLSCNHKNIITLLGVSLSPKPPYNFCVFTPLKWASLEQFLYSDLQDEINFNNEMKQKIIFGISAGLLYCSSKNIICQDLTPKNILLDKDLNPLIGTFGFSKQLDHIIREAFRCCTITWKMRSPVYEAPFYDTYGIDGYPNKQLTNEDRQKHVIYSWAIIVNEILTNQSFASEDLWETNIYQVYDKICQGWRPELIHGEEYKIYQDLIEAGWYTDPQKRPTINQIVKQLLKDEAMLPSVNKEKMREYQNQSLANIPKDLYQ